MKQNLRRLVGVLMALGLALVAVFVAAPKAEAAVVYKLPYTAGKSYRVTQGPNGTYSHMGYYSRYAVDLGMPTGTPVLTSAPGTVIKTGYLRGWGNMVLVKHGDGQCTIYAHLSSIKVGTGASVGAAATLGLSGSTGNSSGPHLHWGLVSCSTTAPHGTGTPNTVEVGRNFYVGQYPVSQNRPGSTTTPAGKTGVITTSGTPLTVRSGPSTSYSKVGTLNSGTTVTIICQTYGPYVNGIFGNSNVWDKIGDGRFVSDAYVRTGSDGLVAPRC